MEYAVVTAIGPDTIGIMDRLAETVASSGANIEETRASILGGEFAIIMLVRGTKGVAGSLGAALKVAGSSLGLAVTVKLTKSPAKPEGLSYIIESISLDTPGIVRAITAVLRSLGINIEDLESSVLAAPLSGSPMFRMRIGINITPGARLNALKEDLSKIAALHDLDVEIRPLKAGDLV